MVLRLGLIGEVRLTCPPQKEITEPNVTKADQMVFFTKVSLVLESLRLEMALDIVLSGLELELYGVDELPFVYWYAERIIHRYLEISIRLASSRSSSSMSQASVISSTTETNQRISNGCTATLISWLSSVVLHFW